MWRFYGDGKYFGPGLSGFECECVFIGASEFGDGNIKCFESLVCFLGLCYIWI